MRHFLGLLICICGLSNSVQAQVYCQDTYQKKSGFGLSLEFGPDVDLNIGGYNGERFRRKCSEAGPSNGDNVAVFYQIAARSVIPVFDASFQFVGTAFEHEGQYLTALHNLVGRRPPFFLQVGPKFFIGVRMIYATNSAAVEYHQDIAVLVTPSAATGSLNFGSVPTNGSTYVEISYPVRSLRQRQPEVHRDVISQANAGLGIMILNRQGQRGGSSGGVVYDYRTKNVIGLALCVNRDNTVTALRLADIAPGLARSRTVWNPNQRQTFVYANECRPIDPRGMSGGR